MKHLFRCWIASLAVLWGAGALFSPAFADNAQLTSEVTVDAIGGDATDARFKAMAQGEQDALLALLEKFNPEQASLIFKRTDPKEIGSLVRSVEVLQEKVSDKRYWARLRINFGIVEIERLIDRATNTEDASGAPLNHATLVIPLYEEDKTLKLWEADNPWRISWNKTMLEFGRGNIVLPYGDNTDAALITTHTAGSVTFDQLQSMLLRYGVGNIVILYGVYDAKVDKTLHVTRRRLGKTQDEISAMMYSTDDQETQEQLFQRASRDIAEQLLSRQKDDIAMIERSAAGFGKLKVMAKITTLASWTEIRQKISSSAMVERFEVVHMRPSEVEMVIFYKGELDSFAQNLQAQGLIVQKGDNLWTVSKE